MKSKVITCESGTVLMLTVVVTAVPSVTRALDTVSPHARSTTMESLVGTVKRSFPQMLDVLPEGPASAANNNDQIMSFAV